MQHYLQLFCMLQWHKGLPIEVLPFAYKPVQLKLEAMGGSAELRIAKQKAVRDRTLDLSQCLLLAVSV